MIMKITKKVYRIMYLISVGMTSLDRLSAILKKSEGEVEKEVLGMLNASLVDIEYREGKIYGFLLTSEGKQILNDKKYGKWFIEFGD